MIAPKAPIGIKPRFDPAQAHRRSLLAKVHIAKLQLGLSDDDYQAVLIRVAGVASAADASTAELAKIVEAFAAQGFDAKARPKGKAQPADHPSAQKARALWISLYHLNAIDNPSEAALEAFAKRQLKVERLQWANTAQAYKLIEALKAIGERHGWSQAPSAQALVTVRALKFRLINAITVKLVVAGLIPTGWRLARIARELAGIEIVSDLLATTEELDRIAKALGASLREHTSNAR